MKVTGIDLIKPTDGPATDTVVRLHKGHGYRQGDYIRIDDHIYCFFWSETAGWHLTYVRPDAPSFRTVSHRVGLGAILDYALKQLK